MLIIFMLLGSGWGPLWAQSLTLPVHPELQLGASVPVGEALRAPYLLGPEALLGLSWLSPQKHWLIRAEGSYAWFGNRPDVGMLTQHEIWYAGLRAGPGGHLNDDWQVHLLLGAGYSWARDDVSQTNQDPIRYLSARGVSGQGSLSATWRERWLLEVSFSWFNPEIELGEQITQQLARRNSLYPLFTIPTQRFAMHRLSLRLGFRL